jgi:hypothetical protein
VARPGWPEPELDFLAFASETDTASQRAAIRPGREMSTPTTEV